MAFDSFPQFFYHFYLCSKASLRLFFDIFYSPFSLLPIIKVRFQSFGNKRKTILSSVIFKLVVVKLLRIMCFIWKGNFNYEYLDNKSFISDSFQKSTYRTRKISRKYANSPNVFRNVII